MSDTYTSAYWYPEVPAWILIDGDEFTDQTWAYRVWSADTSEPTCTVQLGG